MSDLIKYDVKDGIATITLNRPEKRNAMNREMILDFIDAAQRVQDDDAARVLILTGSGGSFCAGIDLTGFATTSAAGKELPPLPKGGRWWRFVDCKKPVICAIDGVAMGMGAEFTSHCDVRIATSGSRFAWNFAQRGLVPDTHAGTWLLPRLIGPGRALHLLYSAEFLSAEDAFTLGYVNEIVAPDQLQDRAQDLAKRYLNSSGFAQARIKELVYEGFTADVEEHTQRSAAFMKECFASEDHKEGVMAFMERREPQFTGR